jgi:photoactive yellow protein
MEIVKFGSDNVENLLAQDPNRIENLPFGAILVDRIGKILQYNSAESAIAGRSPADVIGRNFFNDIAPCAKGHAFQSKFSGAIAAGQVNTLFEYTFDYKMAPTKVRVHLKSTNVNDGIWIFIKRV